MDMLSLNTELLNGTNDLPSVKVSFQAIVFMLNNSHGENN